jgi:non-ribosomal peptide synthetase component F
LYKAYREGTTPPLEELEIQYADYAVWQREWLKGEVLEEQMEYWRRELEGAPEVLELPADRPRVGAQTFRGAIEHWQLSSELTKRLVTLSRQEGVTLFMTLLAAWKTLLYRYTDQEDIVVGTNVANRHRTESEGLMGFFVNNLVLRTALSGNPTFRQLLIRVREVCLGAYINQDIPFDMLVEKLRPERALSHNPLFQVLFVLQNIAIPELGMPDIKTTYFSTDNETSSFDLLLNMRERDQGIVAFLKYNTGLFDPATITQMLARFNSLLEHIATDPDTRLDSLSLTKREAQRLVVAFNDSLE